MDLQMPILDGFETAFKIRNDLDYIQYKNIPIIALTADAFPETRVKVFENKMNDFVTKPFKREELNSKIFKLL